ncbi:TniQ family protein [Marilutibacter chinensis]|uniref:TniQ family protein n=1 Tax=Marilutibacter chinensis TaxID=2912247 RepID=A0ABS9HTH1_9GAMM|nr:TniQ family protein [Lysobacter chinensis]MCF7221598.1 TniQ family protein [Lysobacter chinensis]
MAAKVLRLRIDSPYPGESMSSFLSRAAQFYAMPASTLLKELLTGKNWSKLERRDVDLEPSSMLEQRLSEAVSNWTAPLIAHQGFMEWTLAQRQRHAYCPVCFQEDLVAGRTPYFRNDWIPVFVTTCWKHGTPLFDWEMTYAGGWRRWPRSWVYQQSSAVEDVPLFMQRHLDGLAWLEASVAHETLVWDGICVPRALAYLNRLQELMEKPSAALMPESKGFRSDLDAFQNVARELARLASRHQVGHREPPIGMAACPTAESVWFGPLPPRAGRRHWEFLDYGIRLNGCVRWRRSYLMFVVRTLLGMERFGSLFPPGPALPSPSWRAWWQEVVIPRLGAHQRNSMEWHMQTMLRGM